MLQQILIRTPLYVWLILAALIYRGVIASTDREVSFGKLFIIPALMPLLTVPDLGGKFGYGGLTLACWAGAAAVTTLVLWQFSGARISAGSKAGSVLVRGSWMPLTVMMAIFLAKYALNVMLVVSPQARHDTVFIACVCTLLGVFNGIFFGRMARDTTTWLEARSSGPAPPQSIARKQSYFCNSVKTRK